MRNGQPYSGLETATSSYRSSDLSGPRLTRFSCRTSQKQTRSSREESPRRLAGVQRSPNFKLEIVANRDSAGSASHTPVEPCTTSVSVHLTPRRSTSAREIHRERSNLFGTPASSGVYRRRCRPLPGGHEEVGTWHEFLD